MSSVTDFKSKYSGKAFPSQPEQVGNDTTIQALPNDTFLVEKTRHYTTKSNRKATAVPTTSREIQVVEPVSGRVLKTHTIVEKAGLPGGTIDGKEYDQQGFKAQLAQIQAGARADFGVSDLHGKRDYGVYGAIHKLETRGDSYIQPPTNNNGLRVEKTVERTSSGLYLVTNRETDNTSSSSFNTKRTITYQLYTRDGRPVGQPRQAYVDDSIGGYAIVDGQRMSNFGASSAIYNLEQILQGYKPAWMQ